MRRLELARLTASLIASLLVVARTATAQAVPTDTVLVSFDINAGYDDSEHSVQELAELLEGLPASIAVVRPGETMAHVILRLFSVSDDNASDGQAFESRLPVTYRMILNYILDANPSLASGTLRAGDTLFVPSLPPRASKGNAANLHNAVPIVRRLQRKLRTTQTDSTMTFHTYVLLRDPIDSVRSDLGKGQQTVRLEFWASAEEASRARLPDAHFGLTITRERWRATMGTPNRDSLAVFRLLAPADSSAIAQALTTAGQRSTYLLILDSGWPTAGAADSSIAYLRAIFDAAKRRWNIQPGTGPQRQPRPPFALPKNPHAIRVAEALEGLERLDVRDRVKVIFVPNTREQGGRVVLEELLYIAKVIHLKRAAARGNPNWKPEQMPIEPRYVTYARNSAVATVNELPTETPPDGFAMYADVVQALVDVVNTVAEQEQKLVVFSESWTVQQNVVSFSVPSPLWLVAVVSAGNENGRNVFLNPAIDFAQRSFERPYFAVMSMDSTGARCGTSTVQSTNMDVIYAAGFNGWLPSKDCGTSFAAPRVAWFFAAAEVLRRDPLDIRLYGSHLLERLRAMRQQWAAGAKGRLLFSPRILLGLPANP